MNKSPSKLAIVNAYSNFMLRGTALSVLFYPLLTCQLLASALPTSRSYFPPLLLTPQRPPSHLGFEKWRSLYTLVDWTQAKYYETTKSVQVGLKLVYFTRGPSGILLSVFDTTLQKWVSSQEFPWLSDADGWDLEKHYQTICVAEMTYMGETARDQI